MEYITKHSDGTQELGKKLASQMYGGEVVCLYGDLGAGKTTFTQGFMDYFLPGKRILSPTFIIVRHYEVKGKIISGIYHVDLYRMGSYGEIKSVGLLEIINNPDNIVLVEWAEKLGNWKPKKRIDIHFGILDEEKRKISINPKSK